MMPMVIALILSHLLAALIGYTCCILHDEIRAAKRSDAETERKRNV